ncbi:MAG: NCS2 family permease [bacterium]|nr:NCS2 family permease [bacterium]
MLARFEIEQAGSTVRREIVAGLVTFSTLSYILFVQPAVLSHPACGMDPAGVLFATCVASGVACLLMGFFANHPFALAPAMGHNFFFVFTVCAGMGMRWQEALAANFIAGLGLLALTPTRLRERVMASIPVPLAAGTAAGIGLLIAVVGLQWGGILQAHPVTFVQLGELGAPVALLSLFGLLVCAVLVTRRIPAAILIGILTTAAAGLAATRLFDLATPLVAFSGVIGAPPSPVGTAGELDFAGLFAHPARTWLTVIAVLFLLDLFDSVGSLLGLGRQAGLMRNGELPRAKAALASDAAATTLGAGLGTSTVTTYVESAAGIAAGGRTGLTAVVVGLGFFAALFFFPLFEMIGAGVVVASEPALVVRYPVIAPVLILIGALMIGALKDVDWDEPSDAIPAFLTALLMPLTFSITDGLAWGFIGYSLLGLVRGRQIPTLVHGISVLFVLRYALLS